MGVDGYQVGRMAILNDGIVRMANLAVMASFSVNGVSALHSEILKDTVFHDFYTVMPQKFTNVTNGIAHRRWLNQSNPGLSALVTELIGDGYVNDASQLSRLMDFQDDQAVLQRLAAVKRQNKLRMAKYIKEHNGITVDPDSIFDVQVKRLHEYKRQLMNALHILTTYQWLRENPNAEFVPKTYIFLARRRRRLLFCETDYPVYCGALGQNQQRPGGEQKTKGRISGGLPRDGRGEAHSRGGDKRADFACRHRGQRNQQYEVYD